MYALKISYVDVHFFFFFSVVFFWGGGGLVVHLSYLAEYFGHV